MTLRKRLGALFLTLVAAVTFAAVVTPSASARTVASATSTRTCRELTNFDFRVVAPYGRSGGEARITYQSPLMGYVYYYVDGVYRNRYYYPASALDTGGITITFPNTNNFHWYDAYQVADPNTIPPGPAWRSDGAGGVAPVGANHCQTAKWGF